MGSDSLSYFDCFLVVWFEEIIWAVVFNRLSAILAYIEDWKDKNHPKQLLSMALLIKDNNQFFYIVLAANMLLTCLCNLPLVGMPTQLR